MFVHLVMTSPSSRTTLAPHTGHFPGILNGFSLPVLSSTMTFTTSGITSPALWTSTLSPMRTSFLFTSSSLCSVACETVEPATKTGSSTATGVRAPVLPTPTWMSTTVVVFSSGGNLKAIAQRGLLLVAPRAICWSNELTFMTTPSISVSYTHLRAHETRHDLVCRLLLEKKKKKQ